MSNIYNFLEYNIIRNKKLYLGDDLMNKKWLESELKLSKRIKTLDEFKEKLVKSWTHGDAFRYINNPEGHAKSKRKAEEMVEDLIKSNPELIPNKWK
jgi:phosphopantetheine adenylyltransferase